MVEIRDEGNGMIIFDARTPIEKRTSQLEVENKRLITAIRKSLALMENWYAEKVLEQALKGGEECSGT